MEATSGYQLSDAQVMMTLCTFAYAQENSGSISEITQAILDYLTKSGDSYATGTNWELLGLVITEDLENLMYFAYNTAQPNTVAIVIRGTDFDFWDDIKEDGDVFLTSAFPYTIPQVSNNSMVTDGALDGLNDLLTAAGLNASSNAAQDSLSAAIGTFLKTGSHEKLDQTQPLNLYITGHSLGGALATVFTSWWIYNQSANGTSYPSVNLFTYTFASPTVGNQDYADYYSSRSPIPTISFQGYNVYNQLDIVPLFCSNIGGITNNGWPWGDLGWLIAKPQIEAIKAVLYLADTPNYVQVTELVPLPPDAAVTTPPDWAQKLWPYIETVDDIYDWMDQNHVCNTYLGLLQANPVPDSSSSSISNTRGTGLSGKDADDKNSRPQ